MICIDKTQSLKPPIRLILNSQCNGHCEYCHHEGQDIGATMDLSMVYQCATIASKLSIPSLALSGGEPTLRTDISSVITGIQDCYNGKISLTTNGYGLLELSKNIIVPLHTINLSMTSFNYEIYNKYQNVNPLDALNALNHFPALHKNLNVVVVKDNYLEISEIINYCISHSLSLVIMFELKSYSEFDMAMQHHVLNEFYKLGQVIIQLGVTPSLSIKVNNTCSISVKHPKLSALINWDICQNCKYSICCYERICAVRIYPNGVISPCLNKTISFSNETLLDNIEKAYALFDREETIENRIDAPFNLTL